MDSVYNLLFGCKHRRKTFPLTPVRSKTVGGQTEPAAETYVVCLDCGKQFIYDWEHMQLGKPVDLSEGSRPGAPEAPAIPFRTKSTLRYLLWGSALSAVWVLGKAAKSRKARTGGKDHGENDDIQNPKAPHSL